MQKKSRFTGKQKKAIYFISAIVGTLKQKDMWEDFNVGYEMRLQINRVIEEARKLGKFFRISQEDSDDLNKLVERKEYIVEVFNNAELTLYLKKYRSQTINIKREDLFSLMEYAIWPCENCKSNPKVCKLKQILKNFDIPALDPMKTYRCEYCMNKITK